VPCYNQGVYLREALDSIKNQSFQEWECIIIDDGSTDKNTRRIGEEFTNKDPRFSYFFQVNRGLPVARNEGIHRAKGEYFQFLDADDIIKPNKFSDQLEVFEANPGIDMIYGEYLCFYHHNPSTTWTFSQVTLSANAFLDFVIKWERGLSIPIHCWLYKRECFEKWGGFDESFIEGKEDWDLHLKFTLNGAKLIFHPGVSALYRRQHLKHTMATDPIPNKRARKKLFKKYIFLKNVNVRYKILLIHRYLLELNSYRWFYKKFYFIFKLLKKSIPS